MNLAASGRGERSERRSGSEDGSLAVSEIGMAYEKGLLSTVGLEGFGCGVRPHT